MSKEEGKREGERKESFTIETCQSPEGEEKWSEEGPNQI
jgi:hypothetical protein